MHRRLGGEPLSDAAAFHLVEHELASDCAKLRAAMRPGRWYTKERLHELTGISTHAISARLSDLRLKHGVKTEKKREPGSARSYLYRILPSPQVSP